MKFVTLDNREYSVQPKDYIVYLDDTKKKSSFHISARNLIRSLYSSEMVLEEIPAKISSNKTLFIDFYIVGKKIAIEVNGKQHYEKTMFHKTRADFLNAIKNDNIKKDWCEMNNIRLITLPYDKEEEWRGLIV